MTWTAPRLWPGETLACLGVGPSLTAAQVAALRGKTRSIAINDAWRLAPWADVLYACDGRWWRKHKGVPAFKNLKVTLSNSADQLGEWGEKEAEYFSLSASAYFINRSFKRSSASPPL